MDPLPPVRGRPLAAVVLAADFAAFKHRTQTRKDAARTPYITHPLRVAAILAEEGGIDDADVLQAAILHDTVEDTDTTLDELRAKFGDDVANIVAECSDDKSLEKQERKRLQIVHAPHASPRAKLVKLADKIANLRDLQAGAPPDWSRERVLEYFAWGKQVTDGLRGVNPALEAILDKIYSEGPYPSSN